MIEHSHTKVEASLMIVELDNLVEDYTEVDACSPFVVVAVHYSTNFLQLFVVDTFLEGFVASIAVDIVEPFVRWKGDDYV
jgi:hypothetical protein